MMNAPAARRFWRPRFRLATLFWLLLAAALAFGWWTDRTRLTRRHDLAVAAMRLRSDAKLAAVEYLRGQDLLRRKIFPSEIISGEFLGVGLYGIYVEPLEDPTALESPTTAWNDVFVPSSFAVSASGAATLSSNNRFVPFLLPELERHLWQGVVIEGQPRVTDFEHYVRSEQSLILRIPFSRITTHYLRPDAPAPDVEMLVRLIDAADAETRRRAGYVLARLNQRADVALPALIKLLQSDEPAELRSRAALAIATFKNLPAEALAALDDAQQNPDNALIAPVIRAARFLARHDTQAEAPELELESADGHAAWALVEHLGQMAGDEIRPFAEQLTTLLHSEHSIVCAGAARALSLASLPGEAAEKFLSAFASESSDSPRHGILACLYEAQCQLDEAPRKAKMTAATQATVQEVE